MANVLVVYWSGTGNTEIMAEKISEGIASTGAKVDLKSVDQIQAAIVSQYDKVAFGCPSMGVEVLEEDEFEPFFEEALPLIKQKKVALFGSFGWGNGEWMEAWEERTKEGQAILFDKGLMVQETPGASEETLCYEYGVSFAKF